MELLDKVGGVIPLVGGIVNRIAARRDQARQHQYNLEMLDRQNQYNKPVNQISRLQEAGLNPNLIYGNPAFGGVSANSQHLENPSSMPIDTAALVQVMSKMMDKDLAEKKMDTDVNIAQLNADTSKQNTQTTVDASKYAIDKQADTAKDKLIQDYNIFFAQHSLDEDKFQHQSRIDDAMLDISKGNMELGKAKLSLERSIFDYTRKTEGVLKSMEADQKELQLINDFFGQDRRLTFDEVRSFFDQKVWRNGTSRLSNDQIRDLVEYRNDIYDRRATIASMENNDFLLGFEKFWDVLSSPLQSVVRFVRK